jgi:hypothetical protein
MKRMMLIACLVVAASCGGKKNKEPEGGSGSAVAGSGSAAAGSGSAAAGSGSAAAAGSGSSAAAAPEVPAATDFEAKSGKEITDKNLEQKLGQLEKDLGQ